MKLADLPANEVQRQQSLDSLNLLDTPIEERFDRITRIATHLFRVPIATITLIDGKRQWFKSVQGFPFREGPRNLSFCGHTVFYNKPLVVEDASKDPRFADNPTVTGDPFIRFYAGCPIQSPDGKPIGSFCIIGREPRALTETELDDLKDLAAIAEGEIRSQQPAAAQERMKQEVAPTKRAVLVDSLTRLWNQEGGQEFLNRQQEVALKGGQKFHVAILDLDHFGKINETYGQAAADEVLRELARRFLRLLRAEDFVCRRNGAQFLVMIADPETEDARKVAEKLRQQIRFGAVYVEGKPISVTVSIGLACFDPLAQNGIDKVIQLAEASLAEAKKRGRDRIVVNVE